MADSMRFSEQGGGVIVICTKDRPRDLELTCQAAIAAAPELPIVVIDASSSDDTLTACDTLRRDSSPAARIKYHRATRVGLARQRNQAIEICRDAGYEFVHFIDDDTRVDAGYFDAIERRFTRDATIAGVGGVIANQPIVRFTRLKSMFLLGSARTGVVLRSGRHTLGQYPGTNADAEVDWLSGCSMSFRSAILARFRFDDSLHGCSMGEDADFSFRVSRAHRLAVEPNATCVHTVTPTTRDSSRARTHEGTENTYRRVIRYRALGLSVPAFWWATAGDLAIRGTYALITRDRAALSEVAGILEGIRSIVASNFQRQACEQAPIFPDEEHGGTEVDVAPNLGVAEEGAAR